MENFNRTKHWENIYNTKALKEVSWYEPEPFNSLELIINASQPDSKIIDIGGGDSLLADRLIEKGFRDITVLDISESAINRAKSRLGEKVKFVKWIVADASEFIPSEKYDIWHDRAAFHFLTDDKDIRSYVNSASKGIRSGGTLIIGTFSETGPAKCSGIEIKRYSASGLAKTFEEHFIKPECKPVNHKTPFDTIQNFVFCVFKKN